MGAEDVVDRPGATGYGPRPPEVGLMATHMKKWTKFWLVFAVWLTADLWSKHWADTSLATPSHPLPVLIDAATAGKTLSEVLAERFDWAPAELTAQLALMQKLAPALTAKPADAPFAVGGVADGAKGLWVFWRNNREMAPRRIGLTDRRELAKWLALAVPDATPEAIKAVAQDGAGTKTYESWLPQMFRKIDSDEVSDLLMEGRVHAIPFAEARFGADTKVAAGETWLVLDHEIDVMGDWWKFVYAENPGAAFGFLKGVAPGLRQTLFLLLTLVAFLVIGSIVTRLPARGWLVASAFGAILAGATGNFIDRIRFGYVIDFIDMDLGFMHWPTYNVADIAIAVGVIALLLDLFFNKNSLLATKKKDPKADKPVAV